ncbi:MAG: acyltransferase [Nanoarchaeota archaeon]|nr:acyltransferase [Nanoarchaeota archaeon]
MRHPTSEVHPSAKIGEGTKIWNQAQIREGAIVGRKCNIGKNVYIDLDVTIGNNVKIENNVSVWNGVTVEDDVFIGPNAVFINDIYPRSFIWNEERVAKTLVKKGASIGGNSTILANLSIGKYALVGAGSVVTKDVPDHALVFGNPAKIKGFVFVFGKKLDNKIKEDENIIFKCGDCSKEIEISEEDYKKLR